MNQALQQVNWAVLGCGHIAETFMRSMQSVDNARVISCAARDLVRAKAFADKYEIERYFASYVDMLNDRAVNAVYIATTHNFHFEQIMLCLQHGKHVLCEKPLTLNAKQAAKAFELAKQHNLLLVEAVWTRFLPAIQALQQALESGKIGEVQSIQCSFPINREVDDSHRLKDPKLAGGALLDLGIYPITLADIVFDEVPSKISTSIIRSNTGVDQNSFYSLEYSNGRTAQLAAGFRMSGPIQATIMGDKGEISVPFFLGAKELHIKLEGQPAEIIEHDFPESNNFSFEIQHMTNCLLSNVFISEIMPAATTLRVMTIMDSIREQWGLTYPDEIEQSRND